jgi:hypothetical protein
MIEKIAAAIESAELGYSLRLTRLVEGTSEYTLTYSDGETHKFEDIDDGYEHIRQRRRKVQSAAVLQALMTPTPGMVEAGRAAWLESASDYTRLHESISAAFSAMIRAALEEGNR